MGIREAFLRELGQDLTEEEQKEVNRLLKKPRIAKIRQWDPSMGEINRDVLFGTKKVVEDYVRGKRKRQP